MAGHIQDRWYKVGPGPGGKPVKGPDPLPPARPARLTAHGRPQESEEPLPRRETAGEGPFELTGYFLPWFLTASMAAAAASGSR